MGELIAWIIGWDLILEYAFSNMAVSVGFAAHMVDLMDWLGIHPALRWISPAISARRVEGFVRSHPVYAGVAFRLQFSRLHHCHVC